MYVCIYVYKVTTLGKRITSKTQKNDTLIT